MSAAEKLNPAVQIKLKVLKGPHEGQSFHLSKSSFTLGRGPENEVVLINDPQISRQHARLQVVGQDIEIINLSKKNKVFVGAEEIQKWKLINDSTFLIGETEIQIAFDIEKITPIAPLPQLVKENAVSQLPPVPNAVQVPASYSQSKKAVSPPANRQNNLINRQQKGVQTRTSVHPQLVQQPGRQISMPQQPQHQHQQYLGAIEQKANGGGLLANPKARFYLIVGVLLLGLVYWLNTEEQKPAQSSEVKSTLKYEDEYLLKMNSVNEKELDQKRKLQREQKKSPTNLRIEENFQKGMRDFQLGNYNRALDFFQVVLNLDSSHVLARRHLYLAKIRSDEIIKAKLSLGESYYQKHNFKMCAAMYRQVLTMLEGKNNDLSYQTAQSMSEKCELAAEGIR